jgi:hypothetical protein
LITASRNVFRVATSASARFAVVMFASPPRSSITPARKSAAAGSAFSSATLSFSNAAVP